MADKDIKLDFEDNSKYRVAFDLARQIAHSESDDTKDRKYWLKLYQQCRKVVVVGVTAELALTEKG